jgi:carboxymethylenebutenolidase
VTYECQFAETVHLRGHNNDMIDAYLARPLGSGPYPGVVVIHHMPGWDEAHKEIGRRFAHHGYVTIVPNLQFREGKATAEENSASVRAAGGMPDDRTMGDVQAAIDYLRTLPYLSGKVGVIGYCSGGRQAYLAACTLRGIDAVIVCYGGGRCRETRGTVAAPAGRSESISRRTCSVRCSASSGPRIRGHHPPTRRKLKKR